MNILIELQQVNIEFDKYPPQKFLGDFWRFLLDNKPRNFSINLKWELASTEEEKELQQGTAYTQ